jgi:hypothetical protein
MDEDVVSNIIPAAEEADESVQIARTPVAAEGEVSDADEVIELGDRVRVETSNYGVLEGRVYYRDADLIRVMPDGVSNRVFDFPLEDGEFAADIGVTAAMILEKHRLEGFAAQQDLRPGLLMDTFDEDGRLMATYTIQGVNEEVDAITVTLDGTEEQFNFDFVGIPRDAPFVALGTREAPAEEAEEPAATPEEVADAVAAAAPGPLDSEEAEEAIEDAADEEEFVVVGKMVLPTFIEAEEIPSSEQLYPAHVQKSDALNGFLELMTDSMKKDPRMLRKARALTEMFAGLKNEFLVYDKTGRPVGANPTHMDTLLELFRAVPVPLGRPVLSVAKRYYKDPAAEEEKTIEEAEESVASTADKGYDEVEAYMRHLMRVNSRKTPTEIDDVMKNAIIRDFMEELRAEIRDNKGANTGVGPGAGGSARTQTGSLQYWIWLQSHMHEFMRPWYAADTDGELWDSKVDSEFFRDEFPDFDDPKVTTTKATVKKPKGSFKARKVEAESVSQSFADIPFAIARALGPTYRTDEKKSLRLLKAAESAPLRGYVLFPLLFAPNMGAIRTGMLARDVEYSMRKYMTMTAILQTMGGVSDVPTSNGILALGVEGNTLGNIPVADYLNGIAFSGLGMGSFDLILRQFGLNQFEISMEMNEVLQRKLAATHNSLRVHIDTLRSKLEEYVSNVPTVVNNTLIGAPTAATADADMPATSEILPLEAARAEPMLERVMRDAAAMSPSLATNDIALTAALLARNPDLFTAIASGQPAVVAVERLRAQRAAYGKALESAKAIRELTRMKGEAPKINQCKHVTLLRDVRREGDDLRRMQLMTKFVASYSGARDGNWVNCKACKEHLICMHELLQLKMFHQPREKQAIQKELLLNFNGPLVGGKFQCRNCGQPIAELDFDKNLEFDDEGRPMMGAAPMDTSEEQWEAEKEKALELEIKKEAPIKYDNDSQQEIYEVAKVLADTIGIPLKKDGYDRIIAGVQGFISKRESRETYAKYVERIRKKNPAEAARMMSYDTRLSRFLVSAVGAYMLIEVQSVIPNYVVRFWIPGCKPGFSGYPIGNPENFTGVDYIGCAISTIRVAGAVAGAGSDAIMRRSHWETTGWQKIPSDKDRIQQITELMKNILEKHAVADPGVQAALNAKRQYNQETLGAAAADTEGDILSDTIPVGFLPTQVILTPEEAAAAPVVAEAANTTALAALHVLAAHKYARLNGNIVVGSPFAETVCCTVPVNQPRLFWEQISELPPLAQRALRVGYKGSRLAHHFAPRPQSQINLQSPQHLYYRVFLNVCYTGPNIGHPHELGFTNKCSHCGFQFPASLFAVKDYIETTGLAGGEAKKERARRADELREAERQAASLFAEAGVTINAETFQEVLDASHRNNVVEPYRLPPIMSEIDRVGMLAELDPLPAPNWIGLLEDLIIQLSKLPRRPELADKALATGSLSNEIDTAKEAILIHMESLRARDEVEGIFEVIERADPFSFMEMLQAYIITPAQRLLTSIDAKTVVDYQLDGYAGLAPTHMEQLRKKVMEPAWRVQHAMLKYFNSPKTVLAQMKLQYAIQQFMSVYTQCKRLNAGNVPGGEYVLKYLYHYFFYVILATMLDGNVIPPIATDQTISTFDVSTPVLIETLLVMLRQVRREQVSMTLDQIKEAIKIRTEKENEYFVHRMENRTDDEKTVTMIMKGLKLGEWGVSSAQVQKYDADRFEVERLERMAMGIVDFSEAAVVTASAELQTLFNYGDEMVYTAGEGDGYDNSQFREDDF